MKTLRTISRIFLGALFIFSGFVKGVDPLGTQYRIEDYFIAYHMNWAIPSALYLSMFLCMFEFLMGVLVLFNVRLKLVAWLVLLMMIFFTCTTFYDALYSPVPDCGCFGDAIILTNWQTFWKNVVIMVFVLILFFGRNIIRPTFTAKSEIIISLVFIILFIGFEEFNLRHLPVIDFSKWKTGKRLTPENPKPLMYYLTYKNKETGEEKEYLSPNYPYNDSIWMSHWAFKSQRISDPNPPSVSLIIQDSNKNNITENILRNPNYQFILVAYDLTKSKIKGFEKANELYKICTANGYSFAVLTSTLPETIEKFKKENNLDENMMFLFADDTSLMPIVRSNPGLILIKNSVVLGKWHWRDLPTFERLKEKYLK
jgi:uncharacterized membrane protein YphA (DoxX/SURF4 family)